MGFTHQGSFDASAVNDVISNQAIVNSVALTAGSTIPANLITGSIDFMVLINSTATPGTQTTRTAVQLWQDIIQALGFTPNFPFEYILRIFHTGAGTLTLAAGTGVTLGSGTNSVATGTGRDYVVLFANSSTCTITTIGSVAA